MYKLILFDFDGVIADTFEFCYAIRAKYNIGLTRKQYLNRFNGNIYKAERKSSVHTKPSNAEFFRLYKPELNKQKPISGMSKVIAEAAKKYKLYIISSTDAVIIEQFLRKHGLLGYFKKVLGYRESLSKVVKINRVLKAVGAKPSEAVFVTDTLGDILEAKERGVKSIAVTWGYHNKAVLRSGQPKYIVRTPGELGKKINEMNDSDDRIVNY